MNRLPKTLPGQQEESLGIRKEEADRVFQGGQQSPISTFAQMSRAFASSGFPSFWWGTRCLTLKKHLLHLPKVIGIQGPDKMVNGNVTSSHLRMGTWGTCYTGTRSHRIITGQASLQQSWQENSLGRSLWRETQPWGQPLAHPQLLSSHAVSHYDQFQPVVIINNLILPPCTQAWEISAVAITVHFKETNLAEHYCCHHSWTQLLYLPFLYLISLVFWVSGEIKSKKSQAPIASKYYTRWGRFVSLTQPSTYYVYV